VAGLQLGWFPVSDGKTVAYLLLGFAVPLQFVSSVFAFLGRDSLVGTSFGIFTGTWLGFALTELTSPAGQTNPVVGVFFLSIGGLIVGSGGRSKGCPYRR
jgi:hypothetical protein